MPNVIKDAYHGNGKTERTYIDNWHADGAKQEERGTDIRSEACENESTCATSDVEETINDRIHELSCPANVNYLI